MSSSSGKVELREFSQTVTILGLVLSHHHMLSMERFHAQHMVVRDTIWWHMVVGIALGAIGTQCYP